MRLKDRVAIVTGGARGIREGISRCLAKDGARVCVLDIDGDGARKLAGELGPDDIRVNAICPGLIYIRAWKVPATNLQKRSPQHAGKDLYEIFLEVVRAKTPLKREQTPEDVGKLMSFLCSDDARNITGQMIALDGGGTL
jgi:NAD(P)-dependent dehydrogenase (short-subunit alcohol dehydrogenase family)